MDKLLQRCDTLIYEASSFPKIGNEEVAYYHQNSMTQKLEKWILSVCNLVSVIVPPHNHFYVECQKLISDDNLISEIPYHVTERLTGLLQSLREEIQLGLLANLEYIVMATTFDEFLDHAKHFHKSGKLIESSVLASVVFEDTMRKIAKKNNIKEKEVDLETIINELVKINIFTPVKAKRAKAYGAIRNEALHAHWTKFDLKDIGGLIQGTKELIENYL